MAFWSGVSFKYNSWYWNIYCFFVSFFSILQGQLLDKDPVVVGHLPPSCGSIQEAPSWLVLTAKFIKISKENSRFTENPQNCKSFYSWKFCHLPYSRKHWWDKTSVNCCYSFLRQFYRIFNIHLQLLGHSPNFSSNSLNSWIHQYMFYPTIVFCYTVVVLDIY